MRRTVIADPIGHVLTRLAEVDQAIVIATLVIDIPEREVVRLVPRANWVRRNHQYPDPAWRIELAHRRLRAICDHAVTIDASSYRRSPYVKAMCKSYGLAPYQLRRCAAPRCGERWVKPRRRTGGRPRKTCSPACRQRLYKARQAAAETPSGYRLANSKRNAIGATVRTPCWKAGSSHGYLAPLRRPRSRYSPYLADGVFEVTDPPDGVR
jgi:hypothetical protein